MGTRHLQSVITKEGELKIQLYGQWDGYPSGQGVEILNYLRTGDLNKYQENLKNIPQINEAQIKEVEADEYWKKTYPYLSRDCGSDVHQMIEDGIVKFTHLMDMKEAEEWCEGFYVIDFSKNIFSSKFHDSEKTYPIDSLPTKEQYLKDLEPEEE